MQEARCVTSRQYWSCGDAIASRNEHAFVDHRAVDARPEQRELALLGQEHDTLIAISA